ncbi:hypothetical protein LTR28_007896 [Elasticomyces elasticus]|nr:hypothetical protein LTR28_007896 [Elasticomyces elasticus]
MREQICTDKHPWGTDVYTDDSDPVAAAVHSSWLRGEWDESLDVHNIIGEPKPEVAMQTNTALDAVPQRPVLPLYGEDAHITLSILPPLERVEFVDEGSARYLECGGEARRERGLGPLKGCLVCLVPVLR